MLYVDEIIDFTIFNLTISLFHIANGYSFYE